MYVVLGKSDDDREELMAAANHARNASCKTITFLFLILGVRSYSASSLWYIIYIFFISVDLACSSAFWKKIEPIFAPVSSKDKTYLSTQVGTVCTDNFKLFYICIASF